MDSVLCFINDVGASVKGSFTALITLNYILGQGIVSLLKWALQSLLHLLFTLTNVIQVLLEDLAVFLLEMAETAAFLAERISAATDATISSICNGTQAVYHFVFNLFNSIGTSFAWTVKSVFGVSDLIGKCLSQAFFQLVACARALPQTISYLFHNLHYGFKSSLEAIGGSARKLYFTAEAAPVEAMVGFVSASMFLYLSFKTAKKIILERQITSRHVVHWTFHGLCVAYFFAINVLIGCVRNLFRTVEFTLGHLHVPRFHHAGDSDVEDEEADPDTIPAEALDDSDAEEDERLDRRRRNYEFLIRRRNERRSKSKAKATDEVEDLLFEQVEREREDKLCVICQDQEKCIMILPCRHLCICQNCQIHLMQRNNHAHSGTCPICRKNVKQTIKAYL